MTALALVVLGLAKEVKAQDPHYTQYYVYPSWLNPSLTGVFNGDYRVAGIYRNQWGNITTPFSTPGVSVDVNTGKNASFGISALRQKAGNGGYYYTTAYASMSYSGVRFGADGNHHLNMGFQLGMIQRGFDMSKMTFGDQWNPVTGYNPSQVTSESLTRTKSTSFDAGVGILYFDATPGKKANIFAGVSAAHINRPTDQFSTDGDAKLPVRYNFHAGVRLMLNEVFSLTPNALYMRQGSAEEKMIGAYGQLKVNEETDFLLGVNYRIQDAVSPFVGVYFKNMTLGCSYDVNTSDLSKMARGSNSFEISLTFIGRKKTATPETEFICPRL
ncbi:hypothetical protein FPE01S_01_15970 [Flavihumibacter petaseus NBRC 106054]|uniref:Type IX secretion system membrane protein PorP/SprF n=2 Tax=Flavihumibacter TaxID=1004301 RepID=A0A0E9MXX8_9BACT|nr:hypothetical protein FPE01S_01_15970 [Flavihumibacter petaseus NBRC 106054]